MQLLTTTNLVDAAWSPPITVGTTHWWRRLYQIAMPALSAGTLLIVSGRCNATNPVTYNVQFVDEVTLGSYPNWTDDQPATGPGIIRPAGGMNISPANHYWNPSFCWQWIATCDYAAGMDLEWRVMCHADSGDNTPAPLQPGYGGMQVSIWSP